MSGASSAGGRSAPRSSLRPTSGPVGVLPVLVRVAQQDLAERQDVAVLELVAPPSTTRRCSQSSTGWLMPSTNPNGSTPSRSAGTGLGSTSKAAAHGSRVTVHVQGSSRPSSA